MNYARKSGLMMTLFAPLALMACATGSETEIVTEDPAAATSEAVDAADACGAANYQQYVGEKSPTVMLPAGTVFRHYRTGDAVTMDLVPTRLNFEYDRSGNLVKVSCG